jgi:tetraacyldisaccharide 4'-kinase
MHIKPATIIHQGLTPVLNLVSILFKCFSLLTLSLRSLGKKTYSEAFIISVDNLSFGGTGKTTLVNEICQALNRKKLKFAIVSRGYRSGYEKTGVRVTPEHRVSEVGDEAILLRNNFSHQEIFVGKNRHESIKKALDNDRNIIILDDGFQSTGIRKNLKIMLINPRHPYYYLRNFKWLSRWEDIVLHLAGESEFQHPLKREKNHPFRGYYAFSDLKFHQASGRKTDIGNATLLGFSALGDNQRFRNDLSRFNLKVFRPFPDHHGYNQRDLARLNTLKKQNRIDYLVCTEKDFIKLSELNLTGIPLIYAKNSIKFSFNLNELIGEHVKKHGFI